MEEQDKTLEQYKNEFISLREKIENRLEQKSLLMQERIFKSIYTEVSILAIDGDNVAQDYLGYLFKHGKKNLVEENIETSMQWQILAGANGNRFSLKRLTMFLNYAIDGIVFADDFASMCVKYDITKQNYEYMLGKLICEGIVDAISINPLELSKDTTTFIPYNDKSLRKFDRARDQSLKSVLDYLRR